MSKLYFVMDCITEGSSIQHKSENLEQSKRGIENKLRLGYIVGHKEGSMSIYYVPKPLYTVSTNPLTNETNITFIGDSELFPVINNKDIYEFGLGEAAIKADQSVMLEALNRIHLEKYTIKLYKASKLKEKTSQVKDQKPKTLSGDEGGKAIPKQEEKQKPVQTVKPIQKPTQKQAIAEILPAFKDGVIIDYAKEILPNTAYTGDKEKIISVLKVQRNYYRDENIKKLKKINGLREQHQRELEDIKSQNDKKVKNLEAEIKRLREENQELDKKNKQSIKSLVSISLKNGETEEENKVLKQEIDKLNASKGKRKPRERKQEGPGRPRNKETGSKISTASSTSANKRRYTRKSRITDRDREVVINLYQENITIESISRITRYGKTTIYGILKESGIDRRGKGHRGNK